MKHAVFFIPAIDSANATKAFNAYCSANRVVEVRKEFVADGQNSFWSICVVSSTGNGPIQPVAKQSRPTKTDYKDVLNEQDFHVFSQLRTLRKQIAESEGVPLYHIFTNELYKAAKGKRDRADVQQFTDDLDNKLLWMSEAIRQQTMPLSRYRSFWIFDPKKRLIHAACFEDRVFHHALMNIAGPVFERAMTDQSYACRLGFGVHKAANKVQKHLQQYDYYCKIDIQSYFFSINHNSLKKLLARRFKGEQAKMQFDRIIDGYGVALGRGLPIGSLTSQYFANYYLDGLDRLLNDAPMVRASIRYMDDIIWWCNSSTDARVVLDKVSSYLTQARQLTVKNNIQVQPSKSGISWCGYRITQGTIRMSRRRKRRFQQLRKYWEGCYSRGDVNASQLQRVYASVQAITSQTESLGFRRENLRRHPALEV